MKTILFLFAFCFYSYGQESAFITLNKEKCDSTFVFDYRMIYEDTETPINLLIETHLEERYGYYVNYIQGDINEPENLIIDLYLNDDDFDYVPITKVCVVEKIFQTMDLNKEYKNYIKQSKNH